jgi:predicted DNA binding CopG/RHH family protein
MQEAVAAAPKPPSIAIKLRVSTADLESAKQQAERQGIRYQTYLKMLIHEGLERNAEGRRKTS